MVNRPRRRMRLPLLYAFFAILVVLVWIFVAHSRSVGGSFADVPAYSTGVAADLTPQGNTFVDSLFRDNKREGSAVRVYLTKDDPAKVLNFYQDILHGKGYTESEVRAANGDSDVPGLRFDRTNGNNSIVLLTDSKDDGFVANKQRDDSFIILIEGT